MYPDRTHSRRRSLFMVVAVLAVLGAGVFPASAPAQDKTEKRGRVQGSVIDVTDLTDYPRGDTRIPWTLPEGLARAPEIEPGLPLREEVLTPVDRVELQRRLDLERALAR